MGVQPNIKLRPSLWKGSNLAFFSLLFSVVPLENKINKHKNTKTFVIVKIFWEVVHYLIICRNARVPKVLAVTVSTTLL